MCTEPTQGYELHLQQIDFYLAGDVLMATRPECTIPELYKAYAQIILEADSESMHSHGPQNIAIELLNSKQPPWGWFYNISENKLDSLSSYLEVQLKCS